MDEQDPPPPFSEIATTGGPALPSDLSLITNLREQILANVTTIQHVANQKSRGPLQILTPRYDGQYVAVVVMLQDTSKYQWPLSRLYRSAKRFSVVDAMKDLFEIVADELATSIAGKVDVTRGVPILSQSR